MADSTRERSHLAYQRACRVIPGGVNSPARAFGAVGGQPVVMARGQGAYLYDVDGNRYLDYIGSWGPLILGHCHPRVMEAVSEALQSGSTFGAPTERETLLAELIVAAVPSVEMVRMVNSGTEASMAAIRLARGYTGRDLIVKFAGCYHGHVDALLVQAGSSATTLGIPNSPGVPAGCTRDTLSLQYNDTDGLAQAFQAYGDKIAAVILEPIVGNMGLVWPTREFLAELRRLTHKHGALLIYDEVMTGFRVAYGGAQELFQQIGWHEAGLPDLTVLGKIIGGGLPVGAYGGRAEILRRVAPAGPVFQAGTLSGNPLAMAAGIATLTLLRDQPPYPDLDRLTQRLTDGLSNLASRFGIPHRLQRAGSMWTLFFTAEPVTDYPSALRCDVRRFARFFWAMLDRGVYLPCSQFEAAFVSTAHTEEDIAFTLHAAEQAFQDLTRTQ